MMDDPVFNDVNAMGSTVTSLVNPPAPDYAQITNFLNGSDGRIGRAVQLPGKLQRPELVLRRDQLPLR